MSNIDQAIKTRTITLTDRPPVKIREDEWPVIACADGGTHTDEDMGHYDQARAQGEISKWWLRVRQHADGRALVYGRLDAGDRTEDEDWRGGELLGPGAEIAAAIRRVGEAGAIPAVTIRECIAALPAEEL